MVGGSGTMLRIQEKGRVSGLLIVGGGRCVHPVRGQGARRGRYRRSFYTGLLNPEPKTRNPCTTVLTYETAYTRSGCIQCVAKAQDAGAVAALFIQVHPEPETQNPEP